MSQPHHIALGTVVEATTKPEDIANELIWWLDFYKIELDGEQQTAMSGFRAVLELDHPDPEALEEVSQTLQEWMEALAPPYSYFGSHPDDGADLGFWVAWTSIDADLEDGSLLRSEQRPAGFAGLSLGINERGNTTLWKHQQDGTTIEIWAVV